MRPFFADSCCCIIYFQRVDSAVVSHELMLFRGLLGVAVGKRDHNVALGVGEVYVA